MRIHSCQAGAAKKTGITCLRPSDQSFPTSGKALFRFPGFLAGNESPGGRLAKDGCPRPFPGGRLAKDGCPRPFPRW
jgi:hypothetical protein